MCAEHETSALGIIDDIGFGWRGVPGASTGTFWGFRCAAHNRSPTAPRLHQTDVVRAQCERLGKNPRRYRYS